MTKDTVLHIAVINRNASAILRSALCTYYQATHLLLIYTNNNVVELNNISAVAKERGLRVSTFALNNEFEIDEDAVSTIAAEIKSHQSIYINTSGATPPLLFTLKHHVKSFDVTWFYVDENSDCIVPIPFTTALPISEKLNLRHFLQLFSYTIEGSARTSSIPTDVREVTEDWVLNITKYKSAFARLNYIASKSLHLDSYALTNSEIQDATLSTLLRDLVDIGFIEQIGSDIRFTSEEARFFANGGWLEVYVLCTVRSLRKTFSQLKQEERSLTVINTQNGLQIKNEIDVACLVDNTLHLIECKTQRYEKGDGNNILFKLETLTDLLGGRHAKALLVSLNELKPHELQRAELLKIKVVQAHQLLQLKQKLADWIAQ